jgi:hypothetical protein
MNSTRHITLHRQPIEYTPSMIASLTHKIRPMNLNQMCYDCRMIYNMIEQINEVTHWSESFASTITIDEAEYEAPI